MSATRLRVERERLGLSRAEVARRARVNASYYGAVERGDMRPYNAWVERIAAAIGFPTEWAQTLFEEVDNE